jgi:hypothetical protein
LDINDDPAGEFDRPLAKVVRRWGVGEADGDAKPCGDRENGLSRKYRSLNASGETISTKVS